MEAMEKQILYEKVRAEEPVTKKTSVMRNHRVQEGNTRFNSRASSRASRASDSALESLTVLTVRPAHSQACTKGACALPGHEDGDRTAIYIGFSPMASAVIGLGSWSSRKPRYSGSFVFILSRQMK